MYCNHNFVITGRPVIKTGITTAVGHNHCVLRRLKTLKSSPRRKTYINRTGIMSTFQKYLQPNGLWKLPISDFFKKLILNLQKS